MNLHIRTVLIVENGLLPSAGIAKLLARQADLCVIPIPYESASQLMEQITLHQPEVVVLTSELATPQREELSSVFTSCRHFRLVVVDMEEDCIDVYDKRQVPVSRSNDLLAVVREDSNKPSRSPFT
jgi:hypothetical protein